LGYNLNDEDSYYTRDSLSKLLNLRYDYPVNFSSNIYPSCFILGLEKFPERSSIVSKRLDKVGWKNYQVINGCHFASLNGMQKQELESKWKFFNDGKTSFSNGQKGCAISHLEALEKVVKEELPCVVIAEDDVMFSNNFPKLFENILRDIPKNYDIIFIGWQEVWQNGKKVKKVNKFYKHDPFCTHFYLISSKGAKKIIESIYKDGLSVPIDIWIVEKSKKYGLDNYCVNPDHYKPDFYPEGKIFEGRDSGIVHQDKNIDSIITS
jgi:GR25 family glycosyltransferase involved in LPS biosynthesis